MKTNDHLLKYNNLIIVRFYARPSTQKKKKKTLKYAFYMVFVFVIKPLGRNITNIALY